MDTTDNFNVNKGMGEDRDLSDHLEVDYFKLYLTLLLGKLYF